MKIKPLSILLSMGKSLLNFIKNITAIVVTIAFFIFVGKIFMPTINTEAEETKIIEIGVVATPVYELSGGEIEGTLNAFMPLDGRNEDGVVSNLYSKDPVPAIPLWDAKDPKAIGKPKYNSYGFLGFGYISNLKKLDVVVFSNVNFGDRSPKYISVQIAKIAPTGGVVCFYIEELEEKNLIAIFDLTSVPMRSGENDFIPVCEKIGRGRAITGVHKVYMVVEQDGVEIGQIRFGA